MSKVIGKLDYNVAAYFLVALPIPLLIFHTLIIGGILPYNIVWAGRLTAETVVPFELIAIVLNVLLLVVGLTKSGIIKNRIAVSLTRKAEWFLFWFVLCNTIINPFSATRIEAILFTPIVAIYCVCLFRVIYKPFQSVDTPSI